MERSRGRKKKTKQHNKGEQEKHELHSGKWLLNMHKAGNVFLQVVRLSSSTGHVDSLIHSKVSFDFVERLLILRTLLAVRMNTKADAKAFFSCARGRKKKKGVGL